MLTGWDPTELLKFRTAEGATIDQVVSQFNTALGALNAELANDPLYSGLVSYTDQPDVEYRVGVSNGVERHTEYGRPDAQRADTTGHMLPLIKWDRALGWTWDYLKDARQSQLDADFADAIKDWRDRWRVSCLTRALKRGDDSGAGNGLGASGLSPGFATTAASTGVDFVPPAFGGTTFADTHEHYNAYAGGAFTKAMFTDARDELREHGHTAPFVFFIGPADRATVVGLSGFVEAASQSVQVGTATTVAVAQPALNPYTSYLGVLEDFFVYEVRGMPQHYGFGFKSYGSRSQRNPLAVRLERGITTPRIIAITDPRNGSAAHPLQYLMLYSEMGVGVADRTNGVAVYKNSATWADGTPT
jgi:hypothetical protein